MWFLYFSDYLLVKISQKLLLLLVELLLWNLHEKQVQSRVHKLLIWSINVKIHWQCLVNSDRWHFWIVVWLFYQLQENFILELGRSLLAVPHHIVNQLKDIVQNCLLSDFKQELEDFDCLAFFFWGELSEGFGQRSGFEDKDFGVIFFHAEDTGSFSEGFLEEIVNGKVDDFVHDLGRSGFEFEGRVFAVGRADLTLIGCWFVLFTENAFENVESFLIFQAVFKHLNFQISSEYDIGSLGDVNTFFVVKRLTELILFAVTFLNFRLGNRILQLENTRVWIFLRRLHEQRLIYCCWLLIWRLCASFSVKYCNFFHLFKINCSWHLVWSFHNDFCVLEEFLVDLLQLFLTLLAYGWFLWGFLGDFGLSFGDGSFGIGFGDDGSGGCSLDFDLIGRFFHHHFLFVLLGLFPHFFHLFGLQFHLFSFIFLLSGFGQIFKELGDAFLEQELFLACNNNQ